MALSMSRFYDGVVLQNVQERNERAEPAGVDRKTEFVGHGTRQWSPLGTKTG